MRLKLDIEKIRNRIVSHGVLSDGEINKLLNVYRYVEITNLDEGEINMSIDEYTGNKVYKIDKLLIFEDEIINKED